jgi:hypothetical protein
MLAELLFGLESGLVSRRRRPGKEDGYQDRKQRWKQSMQGMSHVRGESAESDPANMP